MTFTSHAAHLARNVPLRAPRLDEAAFKVAGEDKELVIDIKVTR
jgi:hypothetical protein